MKKILITGATGFLGSHLATAFAGQGHRVIILKRRNSIINRIAPVMDRLTAYNIEDRHISAPFEDHVGIDIVIHVATCYGRHGESVNQIFEANTAFPLQLLETASKFETPVFINTDTVLQRDLNSYALSKRHFAEWGRMVARQMKQIRFVNIRLDHFYGPYDDTTKFTSHVINSCLANVPELALTQGEQKRDFIYIDDVVSAYKVILEAVEKPGESFQEYDVGSGEAITIRHFVETVHRVTRSKTALKFGAIPYRPGEQMNSETNLAPLREMGWTCRTRLEEGIENVIRMQKLKG